jgi:hypothetical protein
VCDIPQCAIAVHLCQHIRHRRNTGTIGQARGRHLIVEVLAQCDGRKRDRQAQTLGAGFDLRIKHQEQHAATRPAQVVGHLRVPQQIFVGRLYALQAASLQPRRHEHAGVLAVEAIDSVNKREVIDPLICPQQVEHRGADVLERHLVAAEKVANVRLALECFHGCTTSAGKRGLSS